MAVWYRFLLESSHQQFELEELIELDDDEDPAEAWREWRDDVVNGAWQLVGDDEEA